MKLEGREGAVMLKASNLLKSACALCLSAVMVFAGVPALSAGTTPDVQSDATVAFADETTGSSTSDAKLETVKVKGTYDYKEAFKVLTLVNKERTKAGLNKLKMSKSLLKTAMQRAAEISVYFSHTRPDGEDCSEANDMMYGENIASGLIGAKSVMSTWMASSGHKANILYPYHTSVGIGCFYTFEGKPCWVQCFGLDLDKAVKKSSYPSTKKITTPVVLKTGKFPADSAVKFKLAVKVKKTLSKGAKTTAYVLVRSGKKFGDTFYEQSLAANSSLKWKSSNKKVATVSKKGKITAKKKGKATITVKSKKGLLAKKFTVTVK